MKKKTLIILGVILIVLIGVGFYFFSNQSTYKVIINNKTNKEISGLQISYSNNSKNISVPSIKAIIEKTIGPVIWNAIAV